MLSCLLKVKKFSQRLNHQQTPLPLSVELDFILWLWKHCASAPFSMAACGRTGWFCTQCNHGCFNPILLQCSECSHFDIISSLLQGKLTKWNFISCLINTQFASAFCQISLCWTCSFNCHYREWAQHANLSPVPPVRYTLTHVFASQPRSPS